MHNNGTIQRIGAAYIRESTEDQDKGFSPQAQEKGIREYAKRNNIRIDFFYKDLISGRSATKRDDFQRMIDEAMQKKFDAILVFHTSRFARNVGEARQYKELLRKKLGIDVISVTQNFGDFEDPSAFLNEGINELFDEHTSRQIGFWVKSACLEKRRQGKQNGNPPLGYYKKQMSYDEEKKRPTYARQWLTHPEEASLVKRIFKMYATGKYSMAEIANILTLEGQKTKYGNPFTYSSLKGLLSNRVYLGLVSSPRKKHLADVPSTNHKAIISQELFDQCQDMISERTKKFGRPIAQHRFYLLQGLLYCEHCFQRMSKEKQDGIRPMFPTMQCYTDTTTSKKNGTRERYTYRCKMGRENKMCSQKIVECSIIDKQIINFMRGFSLPEDVITMTLEKLKEMFVQARKMKRVDTRIGKLLEQRRRLNVTFKAGEMDDNQYLLELQQIKEAIKQLERQDIIQNMTAKQEDQFVVKTERFLRDFPQFLEKELEKEEMRDWILMTIKRIWVKDEKIVRIEPRDDYKPLFKAHQKVIGQAPVVTPLGGFVFSPFLQGRKCAILSVH